MRKGRLTLAIAASAIASFFWDLDEIKQLRADPSAAMTVEAG